VSSGPWWENGIRFECQGSGKCCVSRGEYGYVYVTLKDRRAMAKLLGLDTRSFTKKYCDKDSNGFWKIADFTAACRFLEGRHCTVYEARPTQCRTWPFWPEVMNARSWSKDVASYCPGVGKGRRWTGEEIRRQLVIQKQSEAER
jgi:Fe-S-cluster containining protein